ncbi:MAG TPA: hypothetical protein VMU99_07660 [Acidimicrobiales bacterium]|nr:hypothetical protein [Acidimicrobiales bacterium]
MTPGANEISPTAWVRVTLRQRKVVDVDGDVVSLEFTLDLPDDKAWYQCFAQTSGPERNGSALFVDTNPHFLSAEVLAWKIELEDIPKAALYLADRIDRSNALFVELLERKEQIRRQLEEAARRRTDAIEHAQRLLDASWPVVEAPAPTEPETAEPESTALAPGASRGVTKTEPAWVVAQARGSH